MPRACAPIPGRDRSSTASAILNPAPSSPSRLAAGTLTSSNTICAVGDPRMPSLCSSFGASQGLFSRSSTNAEDRKSTRLNASHRFPPRLPSARARGLRPDPGTRSVEHGQRDLESRTLLAEPVGGRNLDVLEHDLRSRRSADAKLVLQLRRQPGALLTLQHERGRSEEHTSERQSPFPSPPPFRSCPGPPPRSRDAIGRARPARS